MNTTSIIGDRFRRTPMTLVRIPLPPATLSGAFHTLSAIGFTQGLPAGINATDNQQQ